MTDFAALLCSRLCHDLVGPVGAISNGVELLADETDPEMQRRCVQLIADSARHTANKLKFFRLAFGAAGGFGESIETAEARTALEGLFSAGKVRVEWLVTEPRLPKPAVRLLLNLAMTAGDTLLRGGLLNVAAETNGGRIELAVRAEGPRVLLDPGIRQALSGEPIEGEAGGRAAVALLIHCLADEAGARVLVSTPDEGMLLIGTTLPAA